MFANELKTYIDTHPQLVRIRPSASGLNVLKYSRRVFYDGLWNRYLEECRGTIVDDNFNIVSYPFTKIYNYGIERNSPSYSDDTVVDAYRKVNGFMVAITWHNEDLLVSTTGSVDSDYVAMAQELIQPCRDRYRQVCEDSSNLTFMFECVHPNDPHIVPEVEGLYYLGHREKQWHSKIEVDLEYAGKFGCHKIEHQQLSIMALLSLVRTVKHEGFVFYAQDGSAAKIKSPHYLVSKFVARNPRTDKLMRPDVKKSLDEEYYPLIDAIQQNIVAYTIMDEQARLAWVRKFLEK